MALAKIKILTKILFGWRPSPKEIRTSQRKSSKKFQHMLPNQKLSPKWSAPPKYQLLIREINPYLFYSCLDFDDGCLDKPYLMQVEGLEWAGFLVI